MSLRADQAIESLYNPPLAGGSGQVVTDGTSKTFAVKPGSLCTMTSVGADSFYCLDGSALTAANRGYIPADQTVSVRIPENAQNMNVTQGAAAGTVVYSHS